MQSAPTLSDDVRLIFCSSSVRAAPQKFVLQPDVRSTPAPWLALIERCALQRYGNLSLPGVRTLLLAWAHALAASTYSSYFSKFKKFADFCFTHDLDPLPASDATVERYLAFLIEEGRVAAENFPQYLAAVRTVHRDLCFPAPESRIMSLVVSGGKHLQKALHPAEESFPLPAAAALQFLRAGLCTSNLNEVRALAAVVVGFLLCARGSTVQGMRYRDLRIDGTALVFTESVRKGHTHSDRVQRTLAVNVQRLPELLTLLRNWRSLQNNAFRRAGAAAPSHFWQLPGEDFLAAHQFFPEWFALAVSLCPVSVPPGRKLHPHCNRKGAASAARALGVSLEKICRLGGWVLHSRAVWRYIDPLVQPSHAGALFFGWLVPTPVAQLLE